MMKKNIKTALRIREKNGFISNPKPLTINNYLEIQSDGNEEDEEVEGWNDEARVVAEGQHQALVLLQPFQII